MNATSIENMNADADLFAQLFGDEEVVETSGDGFIDAMNDLDNESALVAQAEIEAAIAEEIEAATEAPTEPVAEAAVTAVAELPDDDIAATIADIEKAEALQALYAEKDAQTTPETDGSESKPKPKTSRKPSTSPRLTYHANKVSEIIVARLGDKASETLLLEVGDAALESEELQHKQKELLELLNKRPNTGEGGSTQKKVAQKVVQLFSWIRNGGNLNEVMKRTLKVLVRDGYIASGDKGNLHAELLSKPYSVGTCRAQAGQMLQMLPMLKIALPDGKGRLKANPDSLILLKARTELGLEQGA